MLSYLNKKVVDDSLNLRDNLDHIIKGYIYSITFHIAPQVNMVVVMNLKFVTIWPLNRLLK